MNKRKIKKYLILILLAVILPTGCGKSVEIQDVSGSYEDVDSKDEQKYESQQSEAATGDAISAVTEESILPKLKRKRQFPHIMKMKFYQRQKRKIIVEM